VEAEGAPIQPVDVHQESGSATEELQLRPPDAAAVPLARRRSRKAVWAIVVVFLLVAAGVSVAIVNPFASGGTSQPGVAGNADPTSLGTVTRQYLSSQTEVSATLGYAGSYSVVDQAQGTVTSLPAVGQVVGQGQVLYQVSGAPVILLYGSTPAYRSLSSGTSGPDVQELNADLASLGYATSSELSPTSDTFGSATSTALEKLEAALGVAQNGTLPLGQAVFLPTAMRVTTILATLGGTVRAGQSIMQGTTTTRQVSIALDASEQSEVKIGDKVTITLPNNQTTPGVISSVGTVATAPASSGSGSADGSPTITVLVNPADPPATGTWDQAPVNVTITTGSVSNVLVVPVDALLAQAGGGYAVEVAGARGVHHLVPVSLGLFDDADGLVQVRGSGLAIGQRVVVPAL
jgi:hypothetical protein